MIFNSKATIVSYCGVVGKHHLKHLINDKISSNRNFFFLGVYLSDMEVSRLGVESELKLQGDTTATESQNWICICCL